MFTSASRVAPEKAVFRPALARSFIAGLSPEKEMATRKTYWEKLRDPRWQKRRLEVMEVAGFRCVICSDDKTTLNVHHKLYRKGSAPWEYADSELMCVCETCHEELTNARAELDEILGRLDWCFLPEVTGYAKGLFVQQCWDGLNEAQRDATEIAYDPQEVGGMAPALSIESSDEEFDQMIFGHGRVSVTRLIQYSMSACERRKKKADEGA
jgi:hypothetical protein